MGSMTALLWTAQVAVLAWTPPALGSEPSYSVAPGSTRAMLLAEESAGASSPEAEPTPADPVPVATSARMRGLHRGFGIATWAAMTATVLLGAFQYSDEYGFFAGHDATPCARGEAVFGQWQCDTPVLHLSLAALTTALYATTFTLSYFVRPGAQEPPADSRHGRRLRAHRTLRWVHLAGMAGQIVGGVVVANLGSMGVDPVEHHRVFQGIATWHLAVGIVTWAALTWAGALMI